MTDRPILFSAPMVFALLAGTKTQTRRVVKAPRGLAPIDDPRWTFDQVTENIPCPYGAPGERLWVKETWRPHHSPADHWGIGVTYAADGHRKLFAEEDINSPDWNMPKAARTGNVSPLFMPRWASRLTLEVTGVRVERLQDITRGDAIAEGVASREFKQGFTPQAQFADLWESINGADSWAANPWVWVVSFKRVES